MESDSSAKSIFSLFQSSDLKTFQPAASRPFYQPTASASSEVPHTDDHPRKRRKQLSTAGEWTCAEIRALETYRNLMKGTEIDATLREVLLPNRSPEEIRLQLVRVERTIRERRGTKLQDLANAEEAEFVAAEKVRVLEVQRDLKRRREGLDHVLGLIPENFMVVKEEDSMASLQRDEQQIRASLDQALGLAGESKEQQARRELDEALGLF